VRQLDSAITAARNVRFYAFGLVSAGAAPQSTAQQQWIPDQVRDDNTQTGVAPEVVIAGAALGTGESFASLLPQSTLRQQWIPDQVRDDNTQTDQVRDDNTQAGVAPEAVIAGAAPTDSREAQMDFLRSQGFETVPYLRVAAEKTGAADSLRRGVADFSAGANDTDFNLPVDGLVLTYDDISYGASLGATSKYPRDAIAFKWADEQAETTLIHIEWSASRTGLINPIAVFEPVELEGSTVSRASVHNISIMEELALGAGDALKVYKANMIIPQIAENLTRSGTEKPPKACPVCGSPTEISDAEGIKTLHCTNGDCPARHLKTFAHFVSRPALNIEGLSEQTLEKLIAAGLIHELPDIFKLEKHRNKIVNLEGFGERSFEKLIAAIDATRTTTRERLLTALGVPEVGVSTAKAIVRAFDYDWNAMQNADEASLANVDGVGQIIAKLYTQWFADEKNRATVSALLKEIAFADVQRPASAGAGTDGEGSADADPIAGKTFVITGSLEGYKSRDDLKEKIELLGGKTAGSVSKNTDFLINNDATSQSSKNKKARELGVAVITEAAFEEMARSVGA
jgi:DNA ligase (NAD+)